MHERDRKLEKVDIVTGKDILQDGPIRHHFLWYWLMLGKLLTKRTDQIQSRKIQRQPKVQSHSFKRSVLGKEYAEPGRIAFDFIE